MPAQSKSPDKNDKMKSDKKQPPLPDWAEELKRRYVRG